ncbi:ribosylnicotinamide kinase [Sporothrix epigloea]|uniref:Ribosylnicotinamide kinase n=1 Tax=Sporothrix epigloea TaxID=1892477 RepID=A0ABP0DYX8_9PEZI
MAASERKAVVVGISGCSSSGKTTLARLLRDIFPNTFILHEDDFYKDDKDIPITVDGLADWDCVEALSLPDMEQAIAYIRTHGVLPADLFSKEDQNSVGECPVSDETIEAMKAKVQTWLQPGQPGHKLVASDGHNGNGTSQLRICIFDGFLLYSKETRATMEQIDVRLFLQVSHAKATQRREARDGYVTLAGFWQDPPGYVDKIVWPNYAKAHEWLFNDGNVEGTPNRVVLEDNSILTQLDKGVDIDMASTLEWAVNTMMHELESKYL